MQDSPLLPVKNKYSLIGYYVSFTGFIPLIGLPGSIVAFIFGIMGLQYEKKQHVPGAKAHAIVAVVLGAALALVHLVMIFIFVILATYDNR